MRITDIIGQWDVFRIGARIEYKEISLNYGLRAYDGKTVTGEIVCAVKPFETLSPSLLREWYSDMTEEETRLRTVSGAFRAVVKTDETDAEGFPVTVILELSPDFISSGFQRVDVTEKNPEAEFNYMDLVRQETETRQSGYFQARQGANGYGRAPFMGGTY